jgi:ATP-dependent Clp protease ATP-binding subunit ClpX
MFKILDEEMYFKNVLEAQSYAKKNIGAIVVRSNRKISKKISISPQTILEHLNSYVISQEEAKKDIATTLYYHHIKSVLKNAYTAKADGPIMLIGPTGSGKTFMVKKACEYIDMLFIHVDTSSMVPEGILGYCMSDLVKDILSLAKGDESKASYCVVFFDEIDKLFSTDSEHGASIASQLLSFVEGTKVKITYSQVEQIKNPKAIEELDTSYMQFILGGAFQWIFDKKEDKKQYSLYHFTNQTSKINPQITLDDLYKENIPKELLGRMSTIVNLKKFTKDDYLHILTKSKNSPLQEYVDRVELLGDRVIISDETIEQIAKKAEQSQLGARAIKQIIKKMFKEALFMAPNGVDKTHEISF